MLEPKKFDSIKELSGISERTMTEHYKLYEGYVKKVNEIEEKLKSVDLSQANQSYSDFRELKLEYSFAVGGVKNHEHYFEILGGNGGMPSGKLLELIERDFGSYQQWLDDFTATGISARGWAWLAYDWQTNKLFNYLGDSQNSYPVWHCTPLISLDTYEHAYYLDFATNRKEYIGAFMNNLNWQAVEEIVVKTGIDKL
ncbi:superoxide dismutase [Candidatus Berkelbacteria bacterium]|nr:superoxide dismutase [Candidatus Berkelbacteria bacterium]